MGSFYRFVRPVSFVSQHLWLRLLEYCLLEHEQTYVVELRSASDYAASYLRSLLDVLQFARSFTARLILVDGVFLQCLSFVTWACQCSALMGRKCTELLSASAYAPDVPPNYFCKVEDHILRPFATYLLSTLYPDAECAPPLYATYFGEPVREFDVNYPSDMPIENGVLGLVGASTTTLHASPPTVFHEPRASIRPHAFTAMSSTSSVETTTPSLVARFVREPL